LGHAMLAVLTLAATVAILSVQLAPPRKVKASLTSKMLTVNGQTFPLTDYREARIGDSLVLVPRRTFRLRVAVPLPDADDQVDEILEALARRLDVTPTTDTLLDRMVRWMIRLG
jgi:hypothetical protein